VGFVEVEGKTLEIVIESSEVVYVLLLLMKERAFRKVSGVKTLSRGKREVVFGRRKSWEVEENR